MKRAGFCAALLLVCGPVWAQSPARTLVAAGAYPIVFADTFPVREELEARLGGFDKTMRGLVYEAIVEESARAGFDPFLVLALIHVESRFKGDAVSPAGARGLMQIKPTTLRYLASTHGLTEDEVALERRPDVQIRLGVRYLARMCDTFGSLQLGLLAYNQGPTKLNQLIKEDELRLLSTSYVDAVRNHYVRLKTRHGQKPDFRQATRRGRMAHR